MKGGAPAHMVSASLAGMTLTLAILLHAGAVALLPGGLGEVVAAVVFACGVAVIVRARWELFLENAFVAAAARGHGGAGKWSTVVRLSAVTLAVNLLAGIALGALLAGDVVLPKSVVTALLNSADRVSELPAAATLVRALMAGVLLVLLSYLVASLDERTARTAVALGAGFFWAIGPFDHVLVSTLELLFGLWRQNDVGYVVLTGHVVVTTLGNALGAVVSVLLLTGLGRR